MRLKEKYNITIITPDDSGQLFNVLTALHKANVKLNALCSYGDGQDYSIELILDDVEAAVKAIEELDLDYDITGPRRALLIKCSWSKLCSVLANEYVTIDQAYEATHGYKALVFSDEEYEEAIHCLKQLADSHNNKYCNKHKQCIHCSKCHK